MRTHHRALDFIASLFTAFDVDWDSDYADDGYTDFWGRAPLNEPLFIGDLEDEREDAAPAVARRVPTLPKKHA